MSVVLTVRHYFSKRFSISSSPLNCQSYPRIYGLCKYCSSNTEWSTLDTAIRKGHMTKKRNPAEVYKNIKKERSLQMGHQEVPKTKIKQKKTPKSNQWTESELKILTKIQEDWLKSMQLKNSNQAKQTGINKRKESNESLRGDTEVYDEVNWDFQDEVLAKLRTERNIQWAYFVPGRNTAELKHEERVEIMDASEPKTSNEGDTETYSVYNLRKKFDINSQFSSTSWLEKLRASKGMFKPLSPNRGFQEREIPDMTQLFTGQPKLPLRYLVPTDTLFSKAEKLFEYSNVGDSADNNNSIRSSVSELDISNRQNAGELDVHGSNNDRGLEGFSKSYHVHQHRGETKRNIRIKEDEQNYICEVLRSKSASKKMSLASSANILDEDGKEKGVGFSNHEEKLKAWLEKGTTKQAIAVGHEFMTSYIEVSTFTGMFSKALRDFKEVRDTEYYGKGYPMTLSTYNTLLRGVANTRANLEVMQHLLQYMEEDKIKPDLESYAYCLIIISNRKENILELGPGLLDSIRNSGFDVKDIFNHCELTVQEANGIRMVFKVLHPEIRLYPRHRVQKYTEPLLTDLNIPSSQMQSTSVSSPIDVDEILKKAKEQFNRELVGTVSIPSVWEESNSSDEKMEELFAHWRETVTTSFKRVLQKHKQQAWSMKEPNVFPYLCLFQESEYVDIIMQQVRTLATSKHYSPSPTHTMLDLSQKVYNKYKIYYNIQAKSSVMLSKCYKEYVSRILKTDQCDLNYRQIWQEISSEICPFTPTNINPKPWAVSIHKMIGKLLLNIILKDLKIEVKAGNRINLEKCFRVVNRVRDARTTKEIQPHHRLDFFKVNEITKKSNEVPMVCPPLPFVSTSFGGTLTNTAQILISDSSLHEEWLHKVNPHGVIDSLSILASSAWVINKPVLDIVLHLFREGGAPELGVPTNPKSLVPPKDGTRQEMEKFKKLYAETESLWYSEMYQYSVANMLRDDVFWYSYEMDFRGRNYPVSLVNHQGRDVVRGFMKFAKSKPLGEEGLKWLKIHIVNLTGLKKRDSLEDRLQYAEEIMHEIEDSADKPLHGRKWWMKSDDPFQTLAACMELIAALRSLDPAGFYSNLPLHQDGSCNGLQHYAALGLDVEGAKQVNLYPLDRPSDVYSSVVDEIHREIEEDIKSSEHENMEVVHTAKKYLKRKTIKQSVMTQVYGVTQYGVRKQIMGQLKDTTCPDDLQPHVAVYLTDKTFKSLKSIFSAGKEIQAWFTNCADTICKCGETVRWITPLNFPVIQSYHKIGHWYDFSTGARNTGIENLPVDKLKQRNGFPPNFVHSLDATHMMLTALHCQREGIQFVGVHDSFWTHACDLDRMNKITREQFVALHKQPILENLSKYFQDEYKDSVPEKLAKKTKKKYIEDKELLFENVPNTGDFDLNLVKDSTYFFS